MKAQSNFDTIPLPPKAATAEERNEFWRKIKERSEQWAMEESKVKKAAKPVSCGAEESKINWGDVRCLSTHVPSKAK